jgi:hypothetical protein
MSDEITPLPEIDNAAAMREFFEEIRERAKLLPRNCVEHNQPHVAAKALWLLAQGAPVKQISRITGLGHETIRRLSWQHEDTLESKRKEFSARYAMVAAEYTDLLFEKAEQLANDPEELKKISPDRLALTVGILSDHSAKLSGMAGVVIEHRKGPSIDDAAKAIEEARMRMANKVRESAIEAEIVE